MCALLYQLFCAKEELLKKYAVYAKKEHGEMLKNEFKALWQLWITATTDLFADDVIYILDTLDECRQPDRDRLIKKLKSFYNMLQDQKRSKSKFKFLVISRLYNEIERRFCTLTDNALTIRLAGELKSRRISYEIGIVIKEKVDKVGTELRLDDVVKSALHKRLLEVPHRTYLWLYLTLDKVKKNFALDKDELTKSY